jgi:2-polyprenyl-3-methyl-5-hydroxy-6-metoxy-1,4-benzoquinol methylase
MPKPAARFDADSVRASWDNAADAYGEGQAAGRDYYRYEFFGPAQLALCGEVHGMRVLDVGCGNGYFARELARRGARVTGVDISPRMIAHARQHESTVSLGIEYHVLDAAALPAGFVQQSFDMATSCLALQDMPNVGKVFQGVRSLLQPGGRFVASIAHPCTDTPFREWERGSRGEKRWLCIDRYFERGPLEYTWSGWGPDFTTEAIHATLEDWVAWIVDARFHLRALKEPCPTEQALRARPDLEDATRVPYFLFFDLVRPLIEE